MYYFKDGDIQICLRENFDFQKSMLLLKIIT